ncbi:MAG: GNAT family N-acetyltransferase [Anaerolineaceae bacterium]|nr:MAG: GNAT family N-acetyltransferase [Anaerolineaceae bacterium]
MNIRQMTTQDVGPVAEVHKAAFVRQTMSRDWIQCNFNAYPLMQLFVAEQKGLIVGYILWNQKSGFRPSVVLELGQIAVHPESQGRGVGKQLITDSLPLVRAQLGKRGATLKHIIVTTRADNYAQKLYQKNLGVETEAMIKDLYSADEVFMIRRNVISEA